MLQAIDATALEVVRAKKALISLRFAAVLVVTDHKQD
jgi:hypothetical protein